VLKPEQRQAKRQKIEENRLKKQQLASVTGSVSAQMTDDEHELTRVITDAFMRHLNLPHSNNTSQVYRHRQLRRVAILSTNKKLSYRRGTARCVVLVEILPIATQQCRNYLYDKS